MREFRKKQRRLKKIMNFVIAFSAVYIVVYIGVEPYIEAFSNRAHLIASYVMDAAIVAVLVVVFLYYNRYGKSDTFLERTEHEIDDWAYYYTAYPETDEENCVATITENLRNDGYNVTENTEIDEFEFDTVGAKRKEFFYVYSVESLSRSDILAINDIVINDIAVHRVKRAGNAVICFVTDKAQDDAVALSKMITPIGKKEQFKIAIAIVEPQTRRCYFLGNMETKCQQMVLMHVMGTTSPIAEELKGERHMAFQDELEERMKSFSAKDFKDGTFYSH